jgi:hypothetical protein
MAEAPARVWLRQAVSDWRMSAYTAAPTAPVDACQRVGKHQQAVEKAVKAVLAALRQRGVVRTCTPRGHTINVEISHILSAIGRLPSSRKTNDLVQLVQNLFYAHNVASINDLCSLAPKWPAPGALFPRNAEYPFETAPNTWLAPCDRDVFSHSELNRFAHLAKVVVAGAGKIVSASER